MGGLVLGVSRRVSGEVEGEFELLGGVVGFGVEADAEAEEADGALAAFKGGFEEACEIVEGQVGEAGAFQGGLLEVVEFDFDEDAADRGFVFLLFACQASLEGGEEWGKGLDAVAEGGEVFGVGGFGADAFGFAFGADGAVVDAAA